MVVTFDVETKTKNKGNPFTASGKLVSYSIKPNAEEVSFNYHTSLDFLAELRAYMQQAKLLVGFNIKFDLHWARRHGILPPPRVRVWDCQLAEFIMSGQKGSYPSLDECLAKYGLGAKDDKIAEYWAIGLDTDEIPIDELKFYNNRDVDLTYALYLAQRKAISEKQLNLLMIAGLDLLVLAEMEYNGVKFDIDLCATKAEETTKSLEAITKELLQYSPTNDINLDSGQHLSCLLYGGKFDVDYVTEEEAIYKSGPRKGLPYKKLRHNLVLYTCPRLFEPLPKSETKLKKKLVHDDGTTEEITIYVTNDDTLKQLKAKSKYQKRCIELLQQRAELAKLLDTYYGKLPQLIEKMEWGNTLHGQYNQCVAATGRLSSSAPNMQNFSGQTDQLLISRYK
jgi:DNA polymerase I-like protein with 3'-5' exonuclease and polymerase domains